MTRLETLCERLEESGLLLDSRGAFDDRIDICHLALDSRKVGPRGLFVAVKGVDADGHMFIDKAVQNGAIAVVCEAMPEDRENRFPGVAFVHVNNGRAAAAELAAAFYDDPSRELTLIGVTGTNGKTTVAFLCRHALEVLGWRPGLIGTVQVSIGEEVLEATLTTPDPVEINALLRRMVNAGCKACVMEVSSHALDQERARALAFDAAIFTNLTQDHFDYHRTFGEYQAAKKKLFDGLSTEAVAIYNADDAAGTQMVGDTAARIVSFGLRPGCDIQGEVLSNRIEGIDLRIDGRRRRFRLGGRFNAYNLLAAHATLSQLEFSADAVLDALASADPVPGRLETLRFDDGTIVVLDYAHTPDALENVLAAILDTKPTTSRLWCVFGCGGNRDREKRPIMGRVAERNADRIIVTSDNPRHEDPQAIINDVLAGLQHPERAVVLASRADAIRYAAAEAAPRDIVLIAGKGHETYQIIGDEKRPFDDRVVAIESFSHRGFGDAGNHWTT